MDHSPGFLKLVSAILDRVHEISTTDLLSWQRDGKTFVLVDVREESEWAAGHLPGAIHLGRGILERDIEKAIPDPNACLVLYCGGGYRSALSAESLQKMGYTQVHSLAGGFRRWTEEEQRVIVPSPKV